jgi:excisionase family DNA binding protein
VTVITVSVLLNGAPFPVEFDQAALDAVAAALPAVPVEPWPEWMNVETAAAYLDSSVERLRKLVARRQIPFVQEGPGCRVFFRRSDLDAWMEKQRGGGDA